jgi:hypothetical protein
MVKYMQRSQGDGLLTPPQDYDNNSFGVVIYDSKSAKKAKQDEYKYIFPTVMSPI